MSRRIPRPLRRRVEAHFAGRCAYCHTLTEITGALLVVDHINPDALGGPTVEANLCTACHSCNAAKSKRTAADDPATGATVPLFHPRQQAWRDHFRWSEDGIHILGLTPSGRATVSALNMNHPAIVDARRRWVQVGWHPPQEDLAPGS